MAENYITPKKEFMILVFIFYFQFFYNSNIMSDSYKLIDWSEANDLKLEKSTLFIETIPCNFGQLYKLKDSSFLVMPISPFGKALLTSDQMLLDRWIISCSFPTEEKVNNFYDSNKDEIENLSERKEVLKRELFRITATDDHNVSPSYIDTI